MLKWFIPALALAMVLLKGSAKLGVLPSNILLALPGLVPSSSFFWPGGVGGLEKKFSSERWYWAVMAVLFFKCRYSLGDEPSFTASPKFSSGQPFILKESKKMFLK